MVTKMKRIVCILACIFLFSVSAYSSDMKGSFIFGTGFNLGVFQSTLDGIGDTLLMGGRLHADYAISQWLSIGLETGYSTAKINYSDFAVGIVPILARLAWHPFSLQNLDPYIVGKAGYGVGFWVQEGDGYNWTDPCGGFVWGIDVGLRYFFTQFVGIFLEAGYECQSFGWEHPGMETPKWEDSANGRTYATLGLSIKLDKK